MYKQQRISSYGLMKADSLVCKPGNYDEVFECIQFARSKGLKICPLGAALSFSHVALLNDQVALDITNLDKILQLDPAKQVLTAQAGARISDILKLILPLNFTLAGLTGSLGNTLAGNISNDVNGKDSWKHGNFCSNVLSMKVMLTTGEIRLVGRTSDPEFFNAITGGLGLIAIILEVTLRLNPVPSFMIKKETVKCRNLGEMIDRFEGLNHSENEFAYSWTDAYAPISKRGRGLFEKAHFIESDAADTEKLAQMLTPKTRILGLKTTFFWKMVRNTYSSPAHQLAGYLKYYKPVLNAGSIVSFPSYQYPMVKYLPQWNLLFYPSGFREAQLLFPASTFQSAYCELLAFCRKHKITPFICAIRKHIEQEGLLAFAGNGYSLTLNYGLNGFSPEKIRFIQDQVIELCLKHTGKVYLGKFPFLDRQAFRQMYPQQGQFLEMKQILDPEGLLWSDAASEFLLD